MSLDWTALLRVIELATKRRTDKPTRFPFDCNCTVCAELRKLA